MSGISFLTARRGKMTLYTNIKDDILAKIEDGTYAEGQIIPSEVELSGIYGVSRSTIRQALQILVSTGYLEKRKRRGTIVTRPKVDQSFTTSIRSFEDDMRLIGRNARTNVLLFRRVHPSEEVVARLDVKPDEEVYKLVRLRYVDDQPNVFVESYVPCALFPDLESCDSNTMRLYDAMEQHGRPVATARRRLEVVKADATTASLLDVEEGDPLFLFHTVARDASGVPVEYSIAHYRGESNAFDFDVARS